MAELTNSIDTLQIRLAQQTFDLLVLSLWAHAQVTTGHTDETIHAFTFRPEFLTLQQKIENSHAVATGKPLAYCDKNWHNALRLKNGDVVAMPGIARPIPPAWLAAQAKAIL